MYLFFQSQIVKENNPLENSCATYKVRVWEYQKLTKLFSTSSFFYNIEKKIFF